MHKTLLLLLPLLGLAQICFAQQPTNATVRLFPETNAPASTVSAPAKLPTATNPPVWLSFTNAAADSGEHFTTTTVTGILTNPNFRLVMHALQQRSGSEKLAEPEVTTISGRGENHIQLSNITVNLIPATNPPPAAPR